MGFCPHSCSGDGEMVFRGEGLSHCCIWQYLDTQIQFESGKVALRAVADGINAGSEWVWLHAIYVLPHLGSLQYQKLC